MPILSRSLSCAASDGGLYAPTDAREDASVSIKTRVADEDMLGQGITLLRLSLHQYVPSELELHARDSVSQCALQIDGFI